MDLNHYHYHFKDDFTPKECDVFLLMFNLDTLKANIIVLFHVLLRHE